MRPNGRVLLAAAAALTAVVVVAGVLVARDTGPAQPTLTPVSNPDPTPSPAGSVEGGVIGFSGSDVLTGETVSLDGFRGKPVVINIWASWCPGCNAEARALSEFAEEHPEAAFVGINFQDSRDAARGFYEEHGWTFPSVFDPDGQIAFSLELRGTPTTIFLDSRHREAARIVGETDEQGFADGLAAATRS
ncbi:MAG: TlpA family protein disulfide reductase [Actinobacteria bacterium]|nr:TlpA family protein disulfide reductase [Actinomycetota bacterium]